MIRRETVSRRRPRRPEAASSTGGAARFPRWPTRLTASSWDPVVIDYFDAFTGPNAHAFLSNFWPAEVAIDGRIWATTEHYYQALKAKSWTTSERIRKCRTPGEAKARGNAIPLRPDWDIVRVDVMLRALRAKFSQHDNLRLKLLKTGDALLVEGNTWGDKVWGVVDGEGENLLGLLLMTVRAEFRLAPLHAGIVGLRLAGHSERSLEWADDRQRRLFHPLATEDA